MRQTQLNNSCTDEKDKQKRFSRKIAFRIEFVILVIFLLVLALYLYNLTTNDGNSEPTISEVESSSIYESKLNSVLKNVKNIGKFTVYVSVKVKTEPIYVTEYSAAGVKSVKPATDAQGNISYTNEEYIDSVIVFCENADSLYVRLDVLNVSAAALGISGKIIKIYQINE